jgi:hypothetical protein
MKAGCDRNEFLLQLKGAQDGMRTYRKKQIDQSAMTSAINRHHGQAQQCWHYVQVTSLSKQAPIQRKAQASRSGRHLGTACTAGGKHRD